MRIKEERGRNLSDSFDCLEIRQDKNESRLGHLRDSFITYDYNIIPSQAIKLATTFPFNLWHNMDRIRALWALMDSHLLLSKWNVN